MEIKTIITELRALKKQMIKCSEALAQLHNETELDFTKEQAEQLKQSSDLIQTWITAYNAIDISHNEYK